MYRKPISWIMSLINFRSVEYFLGLILLCISLLENNFSNFDKNSGLGIFFLIDKSIFFQCIIIGESNFHSEHKTYPVVVSIFVFGNYKSHKIYIYIFIYNYYGTYV